ncbi:SLC13 family permease [Paenibacillus periandrae]|uniref:SLC13 family permease n=1 Tax=Paenibacillus periandrae TaxID=1761741 RepID=UPI001F08EE98|nr:SLC13 family permease [Paenibacillus periandrae]
MGTVHNLANWQVLAAIIIALFTLIWIVTGLMHRTYAALGAGLLMVLLGIVEAGSTFGYHLPWQAIGLLIGLMVMIGLTNRTGIFAYAAARAAQISKGKPSVLLIALAMLSTVTAAWLDNLTAILLLIPVTISIAKVMKVSAVPFVTTIIITANLGGTATMIGNLPNMIMGTKAGLTFNDFLINLVPPVIIIWVVTVGLLSLFYAKSWRATQTSMVDLMSIQPSSYIKDKGLVVKVLTVWVLVLAAFLLHPILHFEVAYVALAGAALMSLVNYKTYSWTEIYSSVDWNTLFYICGLFIVVGGIIEAGIVETIVIKAMELTSGNLMYVSILIIWLTGLVSATIDHTLFVALMIPIIQDLGIQTQGALHPLWWSLALGAGLGGSGTLVGAAGNLIAAGLAGRAGHPVTFSTFLKVGAPITLVSLLIATAYVKYMYY